MASPLWPVGCWRWRKLLAALACCLGAMTLHLGRYAHPRRDSCDLFELIELREATMQLVTVQATGQYCAFLDSLKQQAL